MKAEDLIAQLEKINPCSTLDFLNENQEFIFETKGHLTSGPIDGAEYAFHKNWL